MATIYRVGGVIENYEPKEENGNVFTLNEMQNIVSGFIEIINLGDKYMVVNEEGKMRGLGINWEATKIYRKAYPHSNDVIVGNVLVCDVNQID